MPPGSGVAGSGYEAEIRRTTHRVAHIRASSWGSLGFGQGYACAEDHGPTILDQVVKVRGRRAATFGPGEAGRHVDSDVAYGVLGLLGSAPGVMASQPAHVREIVEGFAAGVTRWLGEVDPARLPSWCPPVEAVGTVAALDLFAYAADLALAAGARNFIPSIATARPPGPDGPAPTPTLAFGRAQLASNAWAVGADRSATGHGMVVANPHFPWYGEARFWECHLTLEGELDVYGVSLIGTPGVQMGFNRHVAWAHTFSVGSRFTAYKLDLVPGRPTAYRYGDGEREMASSTVTVEVRGDGGELRTESREVWASHYGPMLNLPLLGWSDQLAFTFRDANAGNDRFLTQFLGMDTAADLDEFRSVFERENGVPWVNTLAADASGRAWYIDASRTPSLSAEGEETFRRRLVEDPVTQLLYQNRVALLDGSDPVFEWADRPGAPARGLQPFDRLPQLESAEWLFNANGPHWLANPTHLVEGYSVLHGVEGDPPSPRSRACMTALAEPGSGAGGTLTTGDLEERLFSNRSVNGELLCAAVAARCREAGTVTVGGREVDLAAAADVLEGWDRRFDLDSVGAVLWREAMATFGEKGQRFAGALWAEPFTLADPLATPRGLAAAPTPGGPDPVTEAVARAVLTLADAGVPIDAPLREVQWAPVGGRRVAVHGGQEADGVANVVVPVGLLPSSSLEPGPPLPDPPSPTGLSAGGYEASYGTAFVMVVEVTEEGPRGRGLLTYGQSGDPDHPAAGDQMEAFAAKELRPLLFEDADIAADPALEVRTVSG